MNLHQISQLYFDEPKFDKQVSMGMPYHEMKGALEEIQNAANNLNRLGIKDFEFVKCSLTDPLHEVHRSIFPAKTRTGSPARYQLKLDRNQTYMIDFLFRYKGEDLKIPKVRVPLVDPGGKFIIFGKTNFVRSVLVDRGVNLAKNELFIRLDRTSFSMARTTHPFLHNKALTSDNILTGNPHRGHDNKKGAGEDKIKATQSLMLYPWARFGWKATLEMMGVDLEIVEGESYDEVFDEYYRKGYTVFGSSGIKTSDGGKKANWYPPKLYLLYKGDLAIGSPEYNLVSLTVANFYYVADRIPQLLSMDVIEDLDFWTNILGRFIFYRNGKPGQWYTEEGENHLTNSIDTLLDDRTRRQLSQDGIDVEDTYELMIWLIQNEKEVYANVHPSDVSRKRIATMRYLLSYIIDNLNHLGYKLLGRTDKDGNFEGSVNAKRLNNLIGEHLRERTIRSLVKKDHGEVLSIESPSTNMFITNTRQLLDQTKVKQGGKERNHMYNRDNVLHASKVTRCRADGIDSATPSGATHINGLLDMSKTSGLDIPEWLQEIEDKLTRDLKGES